MVHGRVLGIDGCRAGWVGIVLGPDPDRPPVGCFGATMAELAAASGPVDVVGVDMPLHLAPEGTRRCDVAARAHLGAKRSSLFPTPPAPAYAAASYAEACAVSRELAGWAPSRQAWALAPKVADLRAWWVAGAPCPVLEVHPEVSFSLMAGGPILARKTTWAGHRARWAALAAEGIVVPDDLGPAGLAGADDVLDAAAAAWTARRVAAGTARSFPTDLDPAHPLQAIWA